MLQDLPKVKAQKLSRGNSDKQKGNLLILGHKIQRFWSLKLCNLETR